MNCIIVQNVQKMDNCKCCIQCKWNINYPLEQDVQQKTSVYFLILRLEDEG